MKIRRAKEIEYPEIVSCRVDERLKRKLFRYCRKMNIAISEYVRGLIREGLDKEGK